MKKIVVIGPESTGKSTLCAELAAHYETIWCPEFARAYLLEHGMQYTYDNLLTIAKGQLELEETGLSQAKNGYYFIDTDMQVMKVWCEVVFQKCHTWILKQIAQREYDLYLLCKTDIPWVADELREYPDLEYREQLYKIYKDAMVNNHIPWVEISGSDTERTKAAIAAIDKLS